MSKELQIEIANAFLLISIVLSDLFGWVHFPQVLNIQILKMIHIFGVILFIGNMIVGPVWFGVAFFTKNMELIHFSSRLLRLTDLWMTVPGSLITIISGVLLGAWFGGPSSMSWIYYSEVLVLFLGISSIGLAFFQEQFLQKLESSTTFNESFNRNVAIWGIIGSGITIIPTIIFYFMVFKPSH